MSLVVDKLKNPCLDYVQHIIFSSPGSTFAAGGQTFGDFAAVRQAFLGQKLSEDALKAGIIAAVNRLLEPVRKHFTENAEASRILNLINVRGRAPQSRTRSQHYTSPHLRVPWRHPRRGGWPSLWAPPRPNCDASR